MATAKRNDLTPPAATLVTDLGDGLLVVLAAAYNTYMGISADAPPGTPFAAEEVIVPGAEEGFIAEGIQQLCRLGMMCETEDSTPIRRIYVLTLEAGVAGLKVSEYSPAADRQNREEVEVGWVIRQEPPAKKKPAVVANVNRPKSKKKPSPASFAFKQRRSKGQKT